MATMTRRGGISKKGERYGWEYLGPKAKTPSHVKYFLNISFFILSCHCVTQLKLYTLYKLSSHIFCCLWVSESGIGVTRPNLHFFQYIQAYKPYTDSVPSNRVTHSILGLVSSSSHSRSDDGPCWSETSTLMTSRSWMPYKKNILQPWRMQCNDPESCPLRCAKGSMCQKREFSILRSIALSILMR